LFDISDTTQMLIVLACSILVFLILHLKENKNGRK
jgi:low affinity Fe/Cu permease